MYIESLLRLADIVDHHKSHGTKLISENYQKETEELIESQVKFMKSELEFMVNNPGPYDFGIGEGVLTVFSPSDTGEQEWAAIYRKGDTQKSYRFNSIMGLVKVLSLTIQESNNT